MESIFVTLSPNDCGFLIYRFGEGCDRSYKKLAYDALVYDYSVFERSFTLVACAGRVVVLWYLENIDEPKVLI
jgi:hypothetical protein